MHMIEQLPETIKVLDKLSFVQPHSSCCSPYIELERCISVSSTRGELAAFWLCRMLCKQPGARCQVPGASSHTSTEGDSLRNAAWTRTMHLCPYAPMPPIRHERALQSKHANPLLPNYLQSPPFPLPPVPMPPIAPPPPAPSTSARPLIDRGLALLALGLAAPAAAPTATPVAAPAATLGGGSAVGGR